MDLSTPGDARDSKTVFAKMTNLSPELLYPFLDLQGSRLLGSIR